MRSLINPELQAALLRNSLSILVSPRARIPKHVQAVLLATDTHHAVFLWSQACCGGLVARLEAPGGIAIDSSVCNRCRVVGIAVVVLNLTAEAFDGRGGAGSGIKRLGVARIFSCGRSGFGRGWVVIKRCYVE